MDKYLLIFLLITSFACHPDPATKQKAGLPAAQKNVINSIPSAVEEDVFAKSIKSARIENKAVFLLFTFKGCGICKIFEKYHNDPVVKEILSDHLIIAEIDINHTPQGKQLYSVYGKMGFPSWSIIDSSKHIIVDSGNLKNGDGNIGFPHNASSRIYYINALKKAATSISNLECNVLIEKLKFYRPDKSVEDNL